MHTFIESETTGKVYSWSDIERKSLDEIALAVAKFDIHGQEHPTHIIRALPENVPVEVAEKFGKPEQVGTYRYAGAVKFGDLDLTGVFKEPAPVILEAVPDILPEYRFAEMEQDGVEKWKADNYIPSWVGTFEVMVCVDHEDFLILCGDRLYMYRPDMPMELILQTVISNMAAKYASYAAAAFHHPDVFTDARYTLSPNSPRFVEGSPDTQEVAAARFEYFMRARPVTFLSMHKDMLEDLVKNVAREQGVEIPSDITH